MRFWLSLFLLVPAALAQAPAEQHNYSHFHFQPPQARKFFAGDPSRKPALVPPDTLRDATPKTCSIPLINVRKNRIGTKYHMRRVPVDPFANEHFRMRAVAPPAPPCDDGKR